MPNFDGIGANEYIMDVTHDVVDFISTADTPFLYELNIWYHTLNCGFRTRVSGETDFPCITDERVGGGRSYVHLPQGLTYDAWCDGVRDGRCYVSDGFSHLMDFAANGLEAGTRGSELRLERPGDRARHRARRLPAAGKAVRGTDADPGPRAVWSPEHARVAGSRDVTVEVVVNGRPVASRRVTADGALRDVAFDVPSNAAAGSRCVSSALRTRIQSSSSSSGPPDSSVPAERGLVPEGGRSVLVAEVPPLQRGDA